MNGALDDMLPQGNSRVKTYFHKLGGKEKDLASSRPIDVDPK